MMRPFSLFLLTVIFFLSCGHPESEFSKTVQNLEQEKNIRFSSYVLYPSTIRMLNAGNDSSFTASVNEIKKVKILRSNGEKDTVTSETVNSFIKGIRNEKFVSLMQLNRDRQQIMIFMRKAHDTPKEFIGIMHEGNSLIVVDLLGNVPSTLLAGLMNGNFNFSGFSKIMTVKPQRRPHGNNSGNQ